MVLHTQLVDGTEEPQVGRPVIYGIQPPLNPDTASEPDQSMGTTSGAELPVDTMSGADQPMDTKYIWGSTANGYNVSG